MFRCSVIATSKITGWPRNTSSKFWPLAINIECRASPTQGANRCRKWLMTSGVKKRRLATAPGDADMIRFLQQFETGQGDYFLRGLDVSADFCFWQLRLQAGEAACCNVRAAEVEVF